MGVRFGNGKYTHTIEMNEIPNSNKWNERTELKVKHKYGCYND